jgi:hypothetical protein
MLAGAARRAGVRMTTLDLNSIWIGTHLSPHLVDYPRRLVGDHDRPDELRLLHETFLGESALVTRRETHESVLASARALANAPFGRWVREHANAVERPRVVGVSVMYRDQVEPALAIAIMAKELWPGVQIVWGGAHVTALRDDIATDARYGEVVDRFVFGYAERTWVDLVHAVATDSVLPQEAVKAGQGKVIRAREDLSITPVFDSDVLCFYRRLTLPMQASRGCGYGKCAFCTYPSIEGPARDVPFEPIDLALDFAARVGAAVSFKDSLIVGRRLEILAARIANRFPWSACTKLDARLPTRLAALSQAGCVTLEVGLETIEPDAQRVVEKRQRWETFVRFLDAAESARIAVVVNYMTRLPGVESAAEDACKAVVECELAGRPMLTSKLEHNRFQLERLSPMGIEPQNYGIRITRTLPWSSVVEWEPLPRLVTLGHSR